MRNNNRDAVFRVGGHIEQISSLNFPLGWPTIKPDGIIWWERSNTLLKSQLGNDKMGQGIAISVSLCS